MADTIIENLITQLSFEFDDDKLDKFNKAVNSAVKGLTAIVAGATAAATAIFVFTKSVTASNDELGKFSQLTGIDVEALQELGFVAELNGGSIDSMNASLSNLARIASEASRGIGVGVEVFGLLGLSVTDAEGRIKSANDLLLDVSDSISRLGSQAEKLEFAQKLGIGADLILSLQQGSEAIKRQREEARQLGFIVDEEATKAAADFNDEMLRLRLIFSGKNLFTGVIKQITPMIGKFVEWFKINKNIINQRLNVVLDRSITIIQGIFTIVTRVVGIVFKLVSAMGGWKEAIIAVTGLLIAMNASALLMPILAIAAGAGILLLLEDLITFAEGGDSAIGKLAERFPIIEIALNGLLGLLKLIKDGWVLIFTDGSDALDGMILLLKDVGSAIKEFVMAPINKVVSAFNKLPGINFSATDGGSIVRESPVNQRNNNVTNNTTNAPAITLNINGGDTEKVKQTVAEVLSQQYSGAQSNLESQVEF